MKFIQSAAGAQMREVHQTVFLVTAEKGRCRDSIRFFWCDTQEQADLKLRAGELKQKEEALLRERDSLEKLRQELDAEKDRLSAAALRLKTRAQEVESFSKVKHYSRSVCVSV